MTTIAVNNNYLTLINIFTTEPQHQEKLIELLSQATETTVMHVPGFISSALHRGLDGKKVTMYAQWRSMEDYQNMRRNPAASPYLDEALKLATFEPAMYEVVAEF
jgi:quinol monooxygenase YgiN